MKSIDEILGKYADLLKDIDEKCVTVYSGAPEIPCKNGCADCCRQLFPLSFVESFFISKGFKKLDASVREKLRSAAKKIKEKIALKNPFQFEKQGVDQKTAFGTHARFARFLHSIEADCPALIDSQENGTCAIYPFRNHDCRVMGCSFDFHSKEIIGCPRFDNLKHLAPALLPFNYRYDEKMQLDYALIREAGRVPNPNILYLTTICSPLLKDYEAEDWEQFFAGKFKNSKKQNEYCVVIDS